MSIFDELKASLQEAVEIKQGNTEASRITRHEVAGGRGFAPNFMPQPQEA